MKVALEGSSYFKLPKILQWLTGNIGSHHIHHVRPNIPNYNLQQCHDEVAAFQVVTAITLAMSLRSLQLGLFDEKLGKPVSFRWLTALGRDDDFPGGSDLLVAARDVAVTDRLAITSYIP